MSKFSILAVAAFLVSLAAHAAEPTVPVSKPITPAPVAAPASKPAVTPQKTALSQQDKMRECNKQATGKKGTERRQFMKTCLSRKA